MKAILFKKVGNRAVALLMTLTMLLTMLPLTTFAATVNDDESVSDNPFITTGQTFVINKLYTAGLNAVGKMLAVTSEQTDCEEYKAASTFINTWIVGSGSTEPIDEVKTLCNEILDELDRIDQKMDSATAQIEQDIQKNKATIISESMDEAWNSEVYNILQTNKFNDVFNFYFEMNLLDNEKNQVSADNIGYFPAAMTALSDEPYDGKIYTAKELDVLRNGGYDENNNQVSGLKQKFQNAYSTIYTTTTLTDEELFTDNKLDIKLQSALNDLILAFNDKSVDYGELCAQYAYICCSDPCDQYDFVISGISKQLIIIGLFEMMYQEFLSMRGEYLEEYHPVVDDDSYLTEEERAVNEKNKAYWDDYEICCGFGNGTIQGLATLHKTFLEDIDSYLNGYYTLDTNDKGVKDSKGPMIKLSQYPKSADFNDGGSILKNTNYHSQYTSEDYRKDSVMGSYMDEFESTYELSSNAHHTYEYMAFQKRAVITNSGIQMCYAVAKDESKNTYLCISELFGLHDINDHYSYSPYYVLYPTCDYYNYTKGVYTDGTNKFTCIGSVGENSNLFNTSAYKYKGSILSGYLGLDKAYSLTTDEILYQIFPTYQIKYFKEKDNVFYDGKNANFYTSFIDTMEINSENATFEDTLLDVRKNIGGRYNTGSKYTVILKNDADTLKNTLKYKSECTLGNASSDIIIKNANSNKDIEYSSGSAIECGEELTAYFEAPPDGYQLDSLKLLRYNNLQNSYTATSEEVILDKNDFDSLKQETINGKTYYRLDFSMPYSNCEFVLTLAKKTYDVTIDNNMKDNPLTLDANKSSFAAGDNVYFRCKGKAGTITIHYGNNNSTSEYIKTWYVEKDDITRGSFQMPESDVVLRMRGDSFNSDSDGTFLISTYDDLCQMAEFVNGRSPKYTDGTYKLMNDIVIPDDANWTPLNHFNGTFDGNGYSISNFHNNGNVEEASLFDWLEEKSVIKNLNMTNINYKITASAGENADKLVSLGSICQTNTGIISNCSSSGEIVVERKDLQTEVNLSVGGICNTNCGTIVDCHNDCNFTWVDDSFSVFTKSYLCAGGICAVGGGETTRCYNTGDFTYSGGILTYIGGIVGMNMSTHDHTLCPSDLTDCYNIGNIKVDSELKDIDYDAVNSFIDEYFTSEKFDVTNESELLNVLNKVLSKIPLLYEVGGITGFDQYSIIKNCYNYGDIYSYMGGYGGICYFSSDTTFENCYYLVSDDTDLTDEQMKHKDSFANGEVAYLLNNGVTDGTQVWHQNIDNGLTPDNYPVFKNNRKNTVYKVDLTEKPYSNYEDGCAPTEPTTAPVTEPTEPATEPTTIPVTEPTEPTTQPTTAPTTEPTTVPATTVPVTEPIEPDESDFIIETYEDLVNMASRVNSGNEYYVNGNYILANDIDCSGETWSTPIGTSSHPFKGTFDGQNFTISNLNIDGIIKNEIALFGVVDGGTIKNLSLSGVKAYVNSGVNAYVSTLCSKLIGGKLTNCNADGNIIVNNNHLNTLVGGICANAEDSVIEKCMSYVDIDVSLFLASSAADYYVGGICGEANESQINNCAFQSSITADKKLKVSGIANCDKNTTVSNCYSVCSDTLDYAISRKGIVDNCYYLTDSDSDNENSTKMSESQFASGEVTYLLNKGVTDGTQAWYQSLDNGLTPDSYPVLTSNGKNTVYKVDLEDKDYSNTDTSVEPTEPTTDADTGLLNKSNLRVYHRVINSDGTVNSNKSDIYNGTGTVDNETKTITIKTVASVDKIGILHFQGTDEKKVGTMTLKGYNALDLTSKEILASGEDEPDIYVDKNKCIFINADADTSDLTLVYQPFDNGSAVEYKVKIEIVELSNFRGMGTISSEKHYEVSDTTTPATEPTEEQPTTTVVVTEPTEEQPTTTVSEIEETTAPAETQAPTDTTETKAPSDNATTPNAVSTSDEAKTSADTKTLSNDAVKTGNVANVVLPISLLISAFVFLYIYRFKKTR